MGRAHHKPVAWQEAISLVKQTYEISEHFPANEAYGLTSQMRRAAVSVPANIAEGVGRMSAKDRIHFLTIARGSLTELDTYAVLARELGYRSNTADLDSAIDRVLALLNGLMKAEHRKATAR